MSRAKLSALLFVSLLAACGGKEKQEAKNPEADTAADASADMPASGTDTASAGGDTKDPAGGTGAPMTPAPEEKKVSIAVAAMKFTPKAKGKKIEIKADGSVMADGKPAGKIAGDHIEDATGKTLATLGSDGGISGDAIKMGLKFSGDDVVGDDGSKVVSVGDDGTVSVNNGKKTDAVGKFDSAGSAKKAAALVAVVWMMSSKDAGAAAAPAGGKPAGGKPAGGAKPAGKPGKK